MKPRPLPVGGFLSPVLVWLGGFLYDQLPKEVVAQRMVPNMALWQMEAKTKAYITLTL